MVGFRSNIVLDFCSFFLLFTPLFLASCLYLFEYLEFIALICSAFQYISLYTFSFSGCFRDYNIDIEIYIKSLELTFYHFGYNKDTLDSFTLSHL